jgi:thiamine-monophosphate kinase
VVHPKLPPERGDSSPTGEDAALERIGSRLKSRLGTPPPGETWSGDDAALVFVPGPDAAPRLLLSTDAVVAGVHVDLAFVTLADVGWKALTVAVSDIAAMGGTPGHALVSVSAPPGIDLEELTDGIAEAAQRWCCPVVGGDLTEAAQLVVTVSVTGTLDGPEPAIHRNGAVAGATLFVTGSLGASAAGLRLLRDSGRADPTHGARNEKLVKAHRRPEARLLEGRAARDAGAIAMMDISDGLGLDLHRLARASGVGFVLDAVPVADGATMDEALGGGEDYELLIAAPDERVLREVFAARDLRLPVRIGVCTSNPSEGRLGNETLGATGYQHRVG